MKQKNKNNFCSEKNDSCSSSCKVEGITSIDERGQMIIPKEIRDKAKLCAGDKLAILSWEKEGELCCITLIKVEKLASKVKEILGPVMGEFLKE